MYEHHIEWAFTSNYRTFQPFFNLKTFRSILFTEFAYSLFKVYFSINKEPHQRKEKNKNNQIVLDIVQCGKGVF